MNKFKIVFLISCLSSLSAFAQYDDIYFNPKTDIPKRDVRKVVTYSDTNSEEDPKLLDDNVSLTEEDYTYKQRLSAFHNENLLVHIEGNDTTIYNLADGSYNVSVNDDGVDISGNAPYAYTNPYYGSDQLVLGWNSWLGMPFYYTNYYSYFGWTPWNDYFYNPWYSPYYDYYNCYSPLNHSSDNTYSDMSNETYRRQHNSAGRTSGTRNTASTASSSTVGSRNSGTSSNQSVSYTNTRKSETTGSRPFSSTSVSTRSSSNSGSSVRVSTSSSSSSSRYSGTSSSSSSSSNSSGSRSGFSSGSHTTSGSGTRSTGTSSGSSSGGSRGGGSSSGGGSRGGGSSTTRR